MAILNQLHKLNREAKFTKNYQLICYVNFMCGSP